MFTFVFCRLDRITCTIGSGLPIILVWLLTCLTPAHAWYTLQHPDIAEAAFGELPKAMRQTLEPYRDRIVWGSMSPDFVLRNWNQHEWNLHPDSADTSAAPAYLAQLSREAINLLQQESVDLARSAELLGEISHYLADLSQPLHTDAYAPEEDSLHVLYEEDAYRQQQEPLTSATAGLRFITQIEDFASNAAAEANLYYPPVIRSYTEGSGYSQLQNLTHQQLRRAVANVRDLWASIWHQANTVEPVLTLQLNQHRYQPGDMIHLTLTSLSGRAEQVTGDLYVALLDDLGGWAFLASADHFTQDRLPLISGFQPGVDNQATLYNLPLQSTATERKFELYAVMVKPGGDPFIPEDYLSHPAAVQFDLTPLPEPAELLVQLNAEPYVLPADNTQLDEPVALLLNRWDFVFVGGKRDDPLTPEHEGAYNDLIPGEYTHAMLYLGRDALARPTFIELTDAPPHDLRLIRMAETEPAYPDGTRTQLPVQVLNPATYASRWGAQLPPTSKRLADQAIFDIYQQLVSDLTNGINYQLEYDWSGNFADREIQLIDDGPAGGASCTDYLLHLLEAKAGICLKGSRLTADDITDYYLFDPAGSSAPVPARFNPFPFRLTTADILSMGYYPVDPPPHFFTCDGSTEIGVPTPTGLAKSPDLQSARQVFWPPFYHNLRQP